MVIDFFGKGEILVIGNQSNSGTSCPQIPPMPSNLLGSWSTGAVLDGTPTICGTGFQPQPCYQYDMEKGNWSKYLDFDLPYPFSDSVLFNGDEWWLLGKATESSNATWILKNGILTQGPPLPVPTLDQCAVKINETHAFISGGFRDKKARVLGLGTYIMRWEDRTWHEMPDMPSGIHLLRVKSQKRHTFSI